MKLKLFFLMITFITLSLNAQQTRIDSLEKVFKSTNSELEKVKILNILSFEYLFIDTTKANACFKKLFKIAESTKDISVKAEATRAIADQYLDLEDYENSMLYYNRAIQLFRKVPGKAGQIGYARTLLNKGGISHLHGDFNEALVLWTEAEPILERYGVTRFLINLYHRIGDVYEQMEMKDKGLIYAQKSIKLSEESGDKENIVRSYYAYVSNSSNTQQNIIYLNKAKAIIDTYDLPQWLLHYYYFNYGNELFNQKRYLQALRCFQSNKYSFDQREELANKLAIANINITLKDFVRSKKLLDQVYDTASRLQMNMEIRDALNLYVALDSIKGNYKQAFLHLQKKIQINERLFTKENQKRMDFLNAKYDATRREAEIQRLNGEKAIQNAAIRQKNIINYAFAAGILFITIIGVVVSRNQKQKHTIAKQKIKELENEKQLIATHAVLKGETDERTRIARDLHDGLGGLLSGTKLILDNMKGDVILSENGVNTYNNALKLLDTSIAELRRVAYNMMPENLIREGLRPALDEFCNSLNNSNNISILFSSFGEHKRFDSNLEIVIFRIAQELLNNALKHSEATEIHVQLVQEPERISVSVQDNGTGFDSANVNEEKSSGLRNIRSRVASFNGLFSLDTLPGKGTEASVEFHIQ